MRLWLIIAFVLMPFMACAQSIGTSSSPTSDNLLQVAGAPIALGQTTRANSLPVTQALDQPPLTDNLVQIGGLPFSLGQQIRTKSLPVTMAWDQPAIPVYTPNVTASSPFPIYNPDTRKFDIAIDSSVANNAIVVPIPNGQSVMTWEVDGLTASGATMKFECSNVYGATTVSVANQWNNCAVFFSAGQYVLQRATITADNDYKVPVGGMNAVRLRVATTGAGIVFAHYIMSSPPTLNGGGAMQPIAGTTAGMANSTEIVPNNTTSVGISGTPTNLYGVAAFNNSATIAYIKLYNAAQGSVTCGSGTPVDRLMIPANSTGAGFIWSVPLGVLYSTAITACVTTGIADSDTTAPAANTYLVSFYFR